MSQPGGHGTAVPAASARGAPVRGELLGGLASTLAAVPVMLTQGLLAFVALGAAGPGVGIPAAVVSASLGGLAFALAARRGLPCAGPTSASTLIYAALAGVLVADPALAPPAGGAAPVLLGLMALTVLAAGLLQAALGALGASRLVQFVPQPVLAGFMNAVALLILLAQLPLLLGWPAGTPWHAGTAWLQHTQPATLGVVLVTLAVIVGVQRLRPRWPASLAGLLVGTLCYQALLRLAPAWPIGATAGALPQALPVGLVDGLQALPVAELPALLGRHGRSLLLHAGLLAVIGLLESAMSSLAFSQVSDERPEPLRLLRACATANAASGLLGGLPVVLSTSRTLAAWNGGARRWQSAACSALVLLPVAVLAGPLLAYVPKAVLAATMAMLAWTMVDRWTRQLLRQWWQGERSADMQLNLACVVVVTAVTLALGLAAGVLLGVLLSALLFIRSMNRSLLRDRYSAAERPSRRIRSAAHEALLAPRRGAIVVLELEGALFFGSAARLADEADALPASTRALVLDLGRVSTLDASGAVVVARIARQLAGRGQQLLLAGLDEEHRHGRVLRELAGPGRPAPASWFADADMAVEAAEQALLREAGVPAAEGAGAPVPLAQSDLAQGLGEAQRARLAALLPAQALAPGERLFAEGDAGDALYVLTRGSVSIVSAERAGRLRHRYVSFAPGMLFGETAVLDERGRTAEAVADGAGAEVHRLPRELLQQLLASEPPLAAVLYRNIAVHLSERLRGAAGAWRSATG